MTTATVSQQLKLMNKIKINKNIIKICEFWTLVYWFKLMFGLVLINLFHQFKLNLLSALLLSFYMYFSPSYLTYSSVYSDSLISLFSLLLIHVKDWRRENIPLSHNVREGRLHVGDQTMFIRCSMNATPQPLLSHSSIHSLNLHLLHSSTSSFAVLFCILTQPWR